MSYIPQAMSGREIQHDIKFAAEGPMSGLVDGVQSLSITGDTTLTLTSGDAQMKCHFLGISVDQDRVVKLPDYVSADLNLGGRRIIISNTTETNGKLIKLTDFADTVICYIGFQDNVEILIDTHNTDGSVSYTLVTKVFKHQKTLTCESTDTDIVQAPAADDNITFMPIFATFALDADASAASLNAAVIKVGSQAVITTDSALATSKTVNKSVYALPASNAEVSDGGAIKYDKGSTTATGNDIIVTVYYHQA